jgi:phage-related protein
MEVKAVVFAGTSLDDLKQFPQEAKREAGYQIDRVQRGLMPSDSKPMASIGAGVREIRIRDGSGAFRIIYVASLPGAIFVLHAFQKKTQATPKRDLALAATRLMGLLRRS